MVKVSLGSLARAGAFFMYICLPHEPSCSIVNAVKPMRALSIEAYYAWVSLPGGPTEIKVEPAAAPLQR